MDRSTRAVIFDLDGVLIDSETRALEAIGRLLREAGVDRTVDELRSLCGHGRGALAAYALELFGDAPRAERLTAAAREAILSDVDAGRMRPYPGAEDAVRAAAAAGLGVAVASSSERRRVDGEISGTDLGRHLDVVVTGDDVARGKPHPDLFLAAAARLAVPPSACLVVEDSHAGIEAARRAGMPVVAVAQTFAAGELGAADAVVPTIAAFAGLLARAEARVVGG